MELGEHDLRGGHSLGWMDLDRDAAAVVLDRHARVDVDGDGDLLAFAGERLVDRVVDDPEDEMGQPALRGVADVHSRTLPDGLEPLEHLDVIGPVGRRRPCTFHRTHPHSAPTNRSVYPDVRYEATRRGRPAERSPLTTGAFTVASA